jgi:hypothetical protein
LNKNAEYVEGTNEKKMNKNKNGRVISNPSNNDEDLEIGLNN